jgi:anthranilate synthase component 1
MQTLTPATYDEFLKYAREGTVVPVVKRVMADLLTPVAAYLKIERLSKFSFLLESVEGGEKVARYSFLGFDPHTIVRRRAGKTSISRNGAVEESDEPMLNVLRRISGQEIPVRIPDLPPFSCGAVGYMSYDAIRWFERIPDKNADDVGIDDAVMMFFSRILAFDHVRHQIHLIANVFTHGQTEGLEGAYRSAVDEIEAIEARLEDAIEPLRRAEAATSRAKVRSNIKKDKFEEAVAKAKEYIAAGDAFQIVLSQRFDTALTAHPFEVYRALRVVNPSPYMFYLKMDDWAVLGASPEMLVRATGRRLEYRPIAGTRARGSTETEDVLLGEEMRADEKEVAEHVMLVDLGRNDLGRVADYGSVEVTDLMIIERYSHVMHLASSIKARLRAGKDRFDALAAAFPAGTVSGAPKIRAMEIIDELEPTRRGVYAGAVMYLDYSGNLDSCIAIRTIVVKNGRAYFQAGAGIVADSVPETEYVETVNKARAMLQAIEMAEGV